MAAYIIRDIDSDLWRKVKGKAALEGVSAKDVILRLLAEWVKKEMTATTCTGRSSPPHSRPQP